MSEFETSVVYKSKFHSCAYPCEKKKKSKFQGRKEGKERRKEVHSPYSDRCYLWVSGVHWAPWKPFIRGENGFPRLYTWDSAPMVFAQQLGIQIHIMTQTQRIRPAPPRSSPFPNSSSLWGNQAVHMAPFPAYRPCPELLPKAAGKSALAAPVLPVPVGRRLGCLKSHYSSCVYRCSAHL